MRGAGGIINERKKNRNNYITEAARTLLYEDSCHGGKNKKKVWYIHTLQGEKSIFCFFFAQTSKRSKNHTHSTLVVLYSCCFFS